MLVVTQPAQPHQKNAEALAASAAVAPRGGAR